eukprot:TRINITY_DN2163_c0_g1_i1.p1 TRINITY_DN2163_c0_g1~~TRINITY_DN2163_c0_g1_i1.p1  ORF type:complete len:389 (-),score=41.49 TRINITY_DN2163_c0_g1_i1:144-1274(-)
MNPLFFLLLHFIRHEVSALHLKGQLNSSDGSPLPSVAALVPVYEDDFPLFETFLKQWNDCSEAQHAVALFAVFASSASAQTFRTQMEAAGVSSSSWSTLLISTGDNHFPSDTFPSAWKKLDALAQVLDVQKFPGLEFAILMDSEIALNSCEGFADVPKALRAKFESRVWYADPGAPHLQWVNFRAASAITPNCADPAQTARLFEQTKHLTVNTWWQDLPWVELKSARRMYSMWSNMLTTTQTYSTCNPGDPTIGLFQAVSGSGPLTPLEVTARMGSFPPPLQYAGTSFEHMIYQYYMVVHEGFRVEVLNINGACLHGSFAECFWGQEAKDQLVYMTTVKPLWVKYHNFSWETPPVTSRSFAPPHGTAVLSFHTDRP